MGWLKNSDSQALIYGKHLLSYIINIIESNEVSISNRKLNMSSRHLGSYSPSFWDKYIGKIYIFIEGRIKPSAKFVTLCYAKDYKNEFPNNMENKNICAL